MDQEERKQHVWCHHGLLRRSRNVRVNRRLHVILDSTKIQKWSWSVPRRWPRNLQGHSKRNWKNQERSLPSVQIQWRNIFTAFAVGLNGFNETKFQTKSRRFSIIAVDFGYLGERNEKTQLNTSSWKKKTFIYARACVNEEFVHSSSIGLI